MFASGMMRMLACDVIEAEADAADPTTSWARDKLPSTCDHLCIDPLLPALNQGPFGTSKVGFGCHEVVLLSSFSLPPRNANFAPLL